MENKNLELNQQEAQVLINLMNVAVKAIGLEGAEPALVFTKRLQALFNTKDELPKKEENVAPEAV